MAKASPPPLRIPISLPKTAEERAYFEALNFALYQIFKRTGGGDDLFDGLQEQIDGNKEAIDDLQDDVASINSQITVINGEITVINSEIDEIQDDLLEIQHAFSWKYIPADKTVTIGTNYQMIVADGLTVDGSLVIDGELSLI